MNRREAIEALAALSGAALLGLPGVAPRPASTLESTLQEAIRKGRIPEVSMGCSVGKTIQPGEVYVSSGEYYSCVWDTRHLQLPVSDLVTDPDTHKS